VVPGAELTFVPTISWESADLDDPTAAASTATFEEAMEQVFRPLAAPKLTDSPIIFSPPPPPPPACLTMRIKIKS
jgi:hypothetical protein